MVNSKVTVYLLAASLLAGCLSGCGADTSSSSASASVAQAASWTNVSVRAMDGTINVNWDPTAHRVTSGSALSTAVTYNVYCATTPVNLVQEKNRIATNYLGLSFNHTNLTNGRRYYYAVTAVTAAGEGEASRVVSATPQAPQPAAPFEPKIAVQELSVTLDFVGPIPPSGSKISYNVYRSLTRNISEGDLLKAGASFPYADTGLTDGTTYYYAMKAVVDGKESPFSPLVSARVQAKIQAVASTPSTLASFESPTDFSVQVGDGSCTVGWQNVATLKTPFPDPAGSADPDYVLYWSSTPDVSPNNYDGFSNNVTSGYTLTGLGSGKKYYLVVVAAVKGADGNPVPGRYTAGPVVSVTIAPKTPAIPDGVVATQGSQQVMLSWNQDASGIPNVTYNVYFSTSDASTPAELRATGTKLTSDDNSRPSFSHTGLQPGRTYYYVVTSVGGGESAPSNIISVTL